MMQPDPTADAHQHPLVSLVEQHFPPIAYGFAYGSGVFHQPDLYTPEHTPAAVAWPAPTSNSSSSSSSGPMIDFIFVVDDPEGWHEANIERNASHYSSVRLLGPAAVARAADSVGAGVWFNTLVPLAGRLIKYGVISRHAFLEDMTTWHHLYVPGRLHKPVLPLVDLQAPPEPAAAAAAPTAVASSSSSSVQQAAEDTPSTALTHLHAAPPSPTHHYHHPSDHHQQLAAAIDDNHISALRVALLLSPPTASFRDVIRRVAGLSYHGDVRMGLAEDSKKVERIVAGSFEGFCDLYLPLLWDLRLRVHTSGDESGATCGTLTMIEGGDGQRLLLGNGSNTGSAAAAAAAWKAAAAAAKQQGAAGVAAEAAAGMGDAAAAARAVLFQGSKVAYSDSIRASRIMIHQDTSQEAQLHAISNLPASLLQRVADKAGVSRPWAAAAAMQVPPGSDPHTPWPQSELVTAANSWRRDVAWAAVKSGRQAALLHAGLRAIIRASSARQAAVGVLSAGVVKSARYIGAKLGKAWWKK